MLEAKNSSEQGHHLNGNRVPFQKVTLKHILPRCFTVHKESLCKCVF